MIGRKSALWLAAAISVLAVTTGTAAAADEQPCNGAVELCSRTLDQVVLPGTHNSMSNEEYGWALPNQHYSIPTQLDMGIRAFLIDTHYGKHNGSTVENSNRANSDGMYLCHEYCQLGSTPLVEELGKVKDFLAANPREVLIFVNQAGVTPADYAQAVTDSGLLPYVYTGSTDAYPTLQQMIDTNQRVVMFSEGGTDDVAWYHDGYAGALQETPYEFRLDESNNVLTTQQGMDQLTNAANLNSTCRPNRGDTTGALFLMNHWVNGKLDNSNPVVPDPEVAQVVNQRSVLVNRARACEARRGKLPNIVAVDDFGDGDLLTAVRELNGLTKPELTLKRPANRVVKAGKKTTYSLAITNSGEEDATAAKVCVAVPGRLAIKPGCRTVAIPQGAAKTLKLNVRTRSRGKGSGRVTFTVSGAGATVRTTANLKVKPVKKKKPKRKRH